MTSRREFLAWAGLSAGALVIGVPAHAAPDPRRAHARDAADDGILRTDDPLAPNEWIAVEPDGSVVIVVGKSEMGQGVRTALPMMVAEELDADWSRVELRQAVPGAQFRRLGTGGSRSVETMWMPLRRAGAQARAVLVAAAAQTLGVPADRLEVANSVVRDPASGRTLPFGDLVEAARALPVPDDVTLKAPDAFTLVGTDVRRVDGPDIVRGTARYGLDVRVPGMRVAALARPPVPGGRAAGWNADAARAVTGVREVVELPIGVAVVADHTWAAFKGREALGVRWDHGEHAAFDSDAFEQTLLARTGEAMPRLREVGDAAAALAAADRVHEATYHFPFQTHAPMEPMNCVAHAQDDRCEIHVPTQSPNSVQAAVARELGIERDAVTVHTTLLGGGFGRRLDTDYATEAAAISKAVGGPVQLVWSREDDFSHDLYQPMSVSRFRAALDDAGRPVAWHHRLAAPAVTGNGGRRPSTRAESAGARTVPYAIPNLAMDYAHVPVPHRMGWWRAIQFVPNVFAVEGFVDELAVAANADPLAYRLSLLGEGSGAGLGEANGEGGLDVARLRGVLEAVRERSGWDTPLPAGRGRGVACLSYDDRTYCAQVAEVSVESGRLAIHRVTTAIDCGLAVNPLGLVGQVESAVVWAVTAILHGEMTFRDGRAAKTEFSQYRVAQLGDMPEMVTHVVPSGHAPSGVGEPPVPAVAPAVVNAIAAATGRRLRRLPVRPQDLA
jgi:isoquinoline 1-oxidoreductase beta subunit